MNGIVEDLRYIMIENDEDRHDHVIQENNKEKDFLWGDCGVDSVANGFDLTMDSQGPIKLKRGFVNFIILQMRKRRKQK